MKGQLKWSKFPWKPRCRTMRILILESGASRHWETADFRQAIGFSSEKDLSCSRLILIFIGEIIVAYIPFLVFFG